MAKTKFPFAIVGVLVLVILVGALVFFFISKPITQTAYFYDKEVGSIKTDITTQTIFSSIQQSVLFTPAIIELGNSVTLTDTFTVPGPNCIGVVIVQIKGPNTNWIEVANEFNFEVWDIGETITTVVQYTPSAAGVWQAQSIYREADCTAPASLPGDVAEASVNNVLVNQPSAEQGQCNPSTQCTDWVPFTSPTEDSINRRFETRTCSSNMDFPACDPNTNGNSEFRTWCNSGYHISGSSDGAQGPVNGIQICEIDSVVIDTFCPSTACTGNDICNTGTGVCESPECNADAVCNSDNSIVTVPCNNGLWGVATGNSCGSSQTQVQTQVDCWSITSANECVTAKLSQCTANMFTTENECLDSLESTTSTGFIITIIIVSIVALVAMVIVINRVTGKKKKNE